MPRPTLAILGQGRLGRSMDRLLSERGWTVLPWRRGQPFPRCEVAWLTVSDASVAQVAAQLPVGPIVLHAAGSLGLDVLAPHTRAGSAHPLQSFPGPEVAMPATRGVPLAVAGHPEAQQVARQIAEDLGMLAFEVPGDLALYHAAAVVSGNFATTLLALGVELLVAAGVPREQGPGLLAPLALASLQQAAVTDCQQALTGPFARGDEPVIEAHRQAIIKHKPALLPAYDAMASLTRQLASRGTVGPDDGSES